MDEPSRLIEINDVELTYDWACIYVDPVDGSVHTPIWAYHSEDECDDESHDPAYVLVMTPDEARTFGETLIHAATHGEVQQRKN